jgi:hypothetical protein
LASLAFAVGLVAANADRTGGSVGIAVLSEAMPILSGLALLGAAVAVFARRPAADFVLAFAGLVAAPATGLANAAVFSHPVPPMPVDGLWVRLAVAVVLAGGFGLTAAGGLRVYRGTGAAAKPRPART